MRIVIVEDHSMIREILVIALRNISDYQVDGFATAEAGIAACLDGADLAVFDHRLPDLTGTEAGAHLRTDIRTKHMPVIIVTGEEDTATKMNAIRAGATEFLTKPVNIDEFKLRVRNLLDLHQAQRMASDRGNLLETLISGSDAALAVADARKQDRPLLYVSKALKTLLSLNTPDMSRPVVEVLEKIAEASTELERLKNALHFCEAGHFVLRVHPDDGLPFWNAITVQPVPEPGIKARFLVISYRNINDMVEMRADLTLVEGRLADIARISGAWFFELDQEFCLSYVSEGMAEAFLVRPEDILGRHVDHLELRMNDNARKNVSLKKLLQSEGAKRIDEILSFQLPDGGLRSVQISMVPYLDDAGAFAGFRGYASDVSTLTEARDQLAHASRAKSAFLATMSHEMRTPLTAILGMAELLTLPGMPPEQAEKLTQITHAATELTEVVGDLLDVARLDDGPMQLDPVPFDPGTTWDQIMCTPIQLAHRKGLTLIPVVLGDRLPLRMGDPTCLGQIVRHLLSNAIKFTSAGTIHAEIDLLDTLNVQIRIRDTGIGMPKNQIARAFEPFCQLDDGIARQFGGRGVGLSIARWLTQSMQGSLTLTSQPGVGTVAELTLPLPLAEGMKPTQELTDLTGCAVLVTDDSAANRRLLDIMLRGMNADVTLCEDGVAALQAWQAHDFDLLLFDINMPHMAGTDLIREIRRREVEANIAPVRALAVTANAMPDQVRDYLAAGFNGCLGKPFTASRLKSLINDTPKNG